MSKNQYIKKITVITPCYNAEKIIDETIESVVNQTALLSGRVNLEYIICDNKSEDNTISIIKSFKSKFIKIISEKDKGMYDALVKGLKIASGQICCYINAGDYYSKHAFDIALDIFEQHEKIKWITGINFVYNERSQLVDFFMPFKYRRSLVQSGFYVKKKLRFIQQESTFWRVDLISLLDLNFLSTFKLAGDYYIWYCFSKKYDLYIIKAYFSGFKVLSGQLSENIKSYLRELNRFISKPGILNYFAFFFDKIAIYFPVELKKIFNKNFFLTYNHKNNSWE